MALYITFLFIASSLVLFYFFILNQKPKGKLPPGPPKLPIIGNIPHVAGKLPHRVLRDLARKYGPIMHLQLGQLSTIVVSSPRLAEHVLKTNDLAVSNRPYSLVGDVVLYGGSDVVFGNYGDYWRQMKKIMTTEALSAKKVREFSGIRDQEINNMIESIRSTLGKPFHLREGVMQRNNNIICRALFGDHPKQQALLIDIVEQLVVLASGFQLADFFPKVKFLTAMSGMKSKLTNVHNELDNIFDELFRERKIKRQTNGATENDLLDVLFNIKERGGLQFPIEDNNIKAIFVVCL